MACNLTTGFELDCKDGVGGVKEVFLVALDDVIAADISFDTSTDEIETLPAMTIYRYELDKNLSSFTDTLTYEDGGMVHFVQEVTVVLKGLTSAKRQELNKLVGRNRVVLFARLISGLSEADKILAFGLQEGLDITSNESSSGVAKGDLQGYTITFSGDEPESAPFLEPYTSLPFYNFGGVTVSPAYPT